MQTVLKFVAASRQSSRQSAANLMLSKKDGDVLPKRRYEVIAAILGQPPVQARQVRLNFWP